MHHDRRTSHSSAGLSDDNTGECKVDSCHEITPLRRSGRTERPQIDVDGGAALVDHIFDDVTGR